MRALRELEPPAQDEGLAAVEQVAFSREPASGLAGVFVAAAAWEHALEHGDTSAPHLVFDWSPDGTSDALDAAAARLAAAVAGPVSRRSAHTSARRPAGAAAARGLAARVRAGARH